MGLDHDFCLIINDYGAYGLAFPETALPSATFEEAVNDIFHAQIENALAVIQFNPVEGLSRDITQDIAHRVAELVRQNGDRPSPSVRRFLDRHGLDYPTEEDHAGRYAVPDRTPA